ncbi:MAG: hypothetical protein FWH17_09855 [Oscillospiraceae bacterium]|nr:hypothetical protein [Oscillospiraceae bacterium]
MSTHLLTLGKIYDTRDISAVYRSPEKGDACNYTICITHENNRLKFHFVIKGELFNEDNIIIRMNDVGVLLKFIANDGDFHFYYSGKKEDAKYTFFERTNFQEFFIFIAREEVCNLRFMVIVEQHIGDNIAQTILPIQIL